MFSLILPAIKYCIKLYYLYQLQVQVLLISSHLKTRDLAANQPKLEKSGENIGLLVWLCPTFNLCKRYKVKIAG